MSDWGLGKITICCLRGRVATGEFVIPPNISITLDRYGHLMPGSEEEAAGLLDAYLTAQRERAEEAARGAGGVHDECLTGELTGEQVANRETEPPICRSSRGRRPW
jgi:hypothetical protein